MAIEDQSPSKDQSPGRWGRGYLWIAIVALLFIGLYYFFSVYPRRGVGVVQPIYFSHRVHAGVKQIPCRFCHPYVERSPTAGIPPMEKCFFCHEYIIPTHWQIVQEKKHFQEGKPVQWVRVFTIPDFVFFNHIPHVRWARLDCTECHGDVKTRDRLVATKFQMGFCIDCHRQKKAQTDCWLACHR